MTTEHTKPNGREELLKAHHVAMNALSDFVKSPGVGKELAMRKAEMDFRILLDRWFRSTSTAGFQESSPRNLGHVIEEKKK